MRSILNDLEITSQDIEWITRAIGNKIKFDEPRIEIIKNMQSVDIQAFPGSGKTTILISKLAILAKKWKYSTRGICVLSHTNVAREEIERRLGNTEVGRKILLYPHFIGTFHSFFDTFVTIPWLKSSGYKINIIDSEMVMRYRWKKIPYKTKLYLQKQFKNENICEYKGDIGKIDWDKNEKTKEIILSIIEDTQKDGYFTFGEMLLLAKKILNKNRNIAKSIQHRFPILFIDEAQDTDEFQWELLNMAFGNESNVVMQCYGDMNQAIYNSVFIKNNSNHFPRNAPLLLKESKRFNNKIAELANSVAVSEERMSGTDNDFSDSIKNTIFLFEKDSINKVIDKFGRLVLNSFTDDEIKQYDKDGIHVIGMIHDKKEETTEKQFPKGIYDYWTDYRFCSDNKYKNPNYIITYLRRGNEAFNYSGENEERIEYICKGIVKLINNINGTIKIYDKENLFNSMLKELQEDKTKIFRNKMLDLISCINELSEDNWANILNKIQSIINLFFDQEKSIEGLECVKWVEDEIDIKNEKNVIYKYVDNEKNRSVDMIFGSIHSVKGKTHLATLVVETYMRTHNIKSINNYLYGGKSKINKTMEKRLKCQYVALSRARGLVCMAIPKDSINNDIKDGLQKEGWNIVNV